MKKSPGLIIAIIVLIAVVIIAIHMTARSVMPYSPSGPYVNQTAFEGFYGKDANPKVLKYSTYPDNAAIDQRVQNDIVQTPITDTTFQRLWGFDGLFGSSNANDNNVDIYSTAPGSMDQQCMNNSNGMSNSKGYLCLDPNQIKLLKSRGGNQTTAQSQIGAY